jgi:hypothetical protein
VPRGEWNENITYEMLDLVNHNGYAWLAKRTVVGIEPSDSHPEYWHNMLDINKIVSEAIASTLAVEVSELLKDELSEARYATDLLAEVDAPTFVHWNTETANTPFTEGLTSISHGYALVEADTLTAWADGEEFTYGANGWDKVITSSGGTMSGPLGLGGGTGSVSADAEGTYIESGTDDDIVKARIVVKHPDTFSSVEEAAKVESYFNGVKAEYNLFGEHNFDNMVKMLSSEGFPKFYFGRYTGNGKSGSSNPNKVTLPFKPIFGCFPFTANGITNFLTDGGEGTYKYINDTGHYVYDDKEISWYNSSASAQYNTSGEVYYYWVIGQQESEVNI